VKIVDIINDCGRIPDPIVTNPVPQHIKIILKRMEILKLTLKTWILMFLEFQGLLMGGLAGVSIVIGEGIGRLAVPSETVI